jgi:hypothetical protein
VIRILFVPAIAIFALLFLAPGIRLLADPQFRGEYFWRRRGRNERLGRVLPRIADWVRITDILGLKASEPDDLRSVGWFLTFIGSVAIGGLVAGLVALTVN